jgi:ribosomal protein S18 acetylase RimI-like enzyme
LRRDQPEFRRFRPINESAVDDVGSDAGQATKTAPQVRSVQDADLPGLLALLSTLHPLDPPLNWADENVRKAWSDILKQTGRQLLVAVSGGVVIGTIDGVVIPNLTHDGQPYMSVENFIVDETHRHQGIGRALMRETLDFARKSGCYKVQLQSAKGH